MIQEVCYYCAKAFGPFEDRYVVSKSTKPPGSPYRWKPVGQACETCIDAHNKPVRIDDAAIAREAGK